MDIIADIVILPKFIFKQGAINADILKKLIPNNRSENEFGACNSRKRNHSASHKITIFLPSYSIVAPWHKVISIWRKLCVPYWVVVSFISHQASKSLKTPQSNSSIFWRGKQVVPERREGNIFHSQNNLVTCPVSLYIWVC